MAVPIIDGIDSETFRYSPVYGAGQHFRGIFEWGFLYKESSVPRKVLDARKYNSEPYKWVIISYNSCNTYQSNHFCVNCW